MYIKAIFVFCGSILLAQTASANCIGGGGIGLSKNIALAELAEARNAGAELVGAEIASARLAGAELANARLAGAELANARLAGAELANARLAGAEPANARLVGAELASARLAGAELAGARLSGCGLGLPGSITPASLPAANGGRFNVISSSPNVPTGINVFSENTIEGPLEVFGQLPLIATVEVDGSLLSNGAAGTTYSCGNGKVGISSESLAAAGIGAGFPLPGLSGAGYAGNLAQAELAGARYAGNLAQAELAGAMYAGNLPRAELSSVGNLALANAKLAGAEIAVSKSLARPCTN